MSWFPIIAAIGYLLPICPPQPPQTPPAESPVPLTQLPSSKNETIIVTDDLKKALDALGASSVVISAERYREMMNQLKQLNGSGEKRSTDILFSRCHISGEVKNQSGWEVVELRFDLECRTQTPNSEVALPFKGLRLTSASVNNATPIFGADSEHPSLIIGEPQVAKIHLEAAVNLSRNGNECRLTLPRIPSAAITSLDLNVPGLIKEASIRGYGSVNITKKETSCALQANALGVLSSLDLSWRLSAPESSNLVTTIESETKITVDDVAAQVEVKMTPVPFTTIGLPWTLRLPASAVQIQAELLRPSSTISEPLIVKKNNDGTILLSSSYSIGLSEYTHIYLRYKQTLPSQSSQEKTILGLCDIQAPADRQHNGTMTVNLPDEAVVLLRPVNLIQIDSQSEREGKRTLGYRFSGAGAGLEAVPLPRSIIRGALEVKLQHTLSVRDGAWILLTDLEVIRSSRANPATLDFFWPADWLVNRKILFSPIVKEIDQDQANQRLRVRLDGKKVGSFALHLESAASTPAKAINLSLPCLGSVQNAQENGMEIVLQQERFRLEAHNCNVKFLGDSTGLEEIRNHSSAGSEFKDVEFSIISHPATLSVTKDPLLPVIQSQADVYFDPKILQIAQNFRIKFDGPVPKHFSILCPIALKQLQFMLIEPEHATASIATTVTSTSGTSTRLIATKLAKANNDLWEQYLLEIPESSKSTFNFAILAVAEHQLGTVTIPLIRAADNNQLSAYDLSVRCLADHRISLLKLPAELPGWNVVSQSALWPERQMKELLLQSTTPERLLAVQLEERRGEFPAKFTTCQTWRANIDIRHAGNDAVMCRCLWQLRDITSTQLTLSVQEPVQNVKLDRCLVNGKAVSTTASWNNDQGCTQIPITMQPRNLLQPAEVTIDFTLVRPNTFQSWWLTIPRMCFGDPGVAGELYQQSWRTYMDRSSWLLYANQALDDPWDRSIFFPHECGAGQSYQFQTIREAAALSVCTLPRPAIVLVCSILSFLAIRFVMPSWSKKHQLQIDDQKNGRSNVRKVLPFPPYLSLFVLLLAGLLLWFPATALALFWGVFPGVVIGMLFLGLERFIKCQRRNQNVFFSAGHIPCRKGERLSDAAQSGNGHYEDERKAVAPTHCPPPGSVLS